MQIIDITMGQWVDDQERAVAMRLLSARLQRGLSREDLAEAIGLDEYELALYEDAKEPVPASVLFLAAIALEIDAMTLLDEAEDDNASGLSHWKKTGEKLRLC